MKDAAFLDGFSVPTGCSPIAVTGECMLPYPSDFLTVPDPTTGTGLRLALPAGSLVVPTNSKAIDMTPFNRGDGAPTSSPILMHFGVVISPSFLADDTQTAGTLLKSSPIALLDESPRRHACRSCRRWTQTTRPGSGSARSSFARSTPLAPATKYIVAITERGARRERQRAPPVEGGFVALRDQIATGVPAIEGARTRYEQIFTTLAANGYARDTLQLAWDYTTVSSSRVIGPITAMRDVVFNAATSAAPPVPDAGAWTPRSRRRRRAVTLQRRARRRGGAAPSRTRIESVTRRRRT